jgi:hypothetical protein
VVGHTPEVRGCISARRVLRALSSATTIAIAVPCKILARGRHGVPELTLWFGQVIARNGGLE